MHIKDFKIIYAPAAMVNWQEAGRTWPRPHPHAARLLRGLVWDQHYRHSNPQCEGGMPRSFELRTDIAPDRLQAVEDWLRAEGYEYRHQQRRWRAWTRPDRPGEGLRPDGIEEDEEPNAYPSGASINVSLWDVIEKKFPEPGNERRLQGSSSASPATEKRSAGDKKRDRRWREYQESLAAEAAQGAKGGTPAPSPQRPNGGHHPGSTTLGDYIQVAKQTQAKPRPLLLRARQASAGPSSDIESAHRGRTPADQASSSSSVAPERDVARACERACGVPCNRRVARQRAKQYSAAVEGAAGIAQEEAAQWAHGMAIHTQTVAAIAAGFTAVAAHGVATAQVNDELAAADEEARLTQEAIACKEAEVKALGEALAQERAKKEAEERAHAEATAKAHEDAAKKEAIEAARRKVAEEKAKTEAELAALEAQKAQLLQAREAEAARAREEAEARAAAATAAAMEEAEAKLRHETPPGGSRVEVDTGKSEMARISTVAARAQKDLDIARAETKSLTNVVSGLQERLDALEARGRVGSDHPPLESGSSDDGWGPGPGPGRPHAPGGAPRSRPSASAPSLTAPSHHSAGRRNEHVPPGSGSEEWRDEWLSADYHNRRAPPRTPVRPRRPPPAPAPIPRAGGRYGGLRDEVPRGDVEWDVGEGEDLDLDLDLEEFDISPPRGVRREAAERSRRRRDEDAYMDAVRREHFGSAYVEEPRRSHRDSMEEMDVAAVGVRGRGRWEPRSTSRPAFMVSKAADAAVWEDLKDIKPPMYDGNPLNLDRFLEKLDDWGLAVTEDQPPADAERYVFKRFRYRLPEVLGELYFVATKEGKIKTLKDAKKWLNEQERVDAPQVAAKRWKSIKLEHDGREIRLREWRDFRGKYTLFRRNVEDWNEGDEQARLLSMLPEAWIKRVTKEESKRAKSNHTVKMMLPKEYHTNVVSWAKKNVARDVKRHSLRNALLITVSGDREKTAIWRLDDCELSGQTIRLQPIPARMSCDEILEWVGEEVLKEYRNLHHTRGLRPGDRDVNYVGEGPGGEDAMDPAGAGGDETLVDDDDDDEPAEVAVCAFVAKNLSAGTKPANWKPLQQGWRKQEKRDPRRIGDPPLSFGEFIRAHPQGCFVCYGRKKGFNHDHRTCPVHKADTEAYKKAHGSKKRAPAGIREAKMEVDKDELAKLMSSVGTELAKEIQEIKRNWVPRSDNKNKENNQNDQNKDKDKKGKGGGKGGRKKGINDVEAEENTPSSTTDAP